MHDENLIAPLTDDELLVLDHLWDLDWESMSFAELRFLVPEWLDLSALQAALTGLLEKDMIEIEAIEEEAGRPRTKRSLTTPAARRAIGDPRAWIRYDEPGFSSSAEYYEVIPDAQSASLYQVALDQRSLKPGYSIAEVG